MSFTGVLLGIIVAIFADPALVLSIDYTAQDRELAVTLKPRG